MTIILFIAQCFSLSTAILSLALVAVRVIESIYQLRQKPALDTWQKCWQAIKNFFTIEKYA